MTDKCIMIGMIEKCIDPHVSWLTDDLKDKNNNNYFVVVV